MFYRFWGFQLFYVWMCGMSVSWPSLVSFFSNINHLICLGQVWPVPFNIFSPWVVPTWLYGMVVHDVYIWLVVWNIFYVSIYYGNNHPNWLIFFGCFKPPTRYYCFKLGTVQTLDRFPGFDASSFQILHMSCFLAHPWIHGDTVAPITFVCWFPKWKAS